MLLWLGAIGLTGTASVQAAPDLCRIAAQAVPGRACHANPHGVVLAPDPAEAARLGAILRSGEQRFQRHFGQPPPRYAVVQDAQPNDRTTLGAAGFQRTLGWLTAAQFEASALASVRRGAEDQARAQGLSGEQLAAAVTQAETAWRGRNSTTVRNEREEGVVPHEAGHGWYIEAYWPGVATDRGGHYGGPSPDWMDETAAILMEDDRLTASRREQFAQVYHGSPASPMLAGITAAELIDLPLFLSREHPAKSLQAPFTIRAGTPGVNPAGGVRVLTGPEAQRLARGGILFYLQGRMFADFLIERTGEPAVFARIGGAFGRGETMAQWLARDGAALHLPTDIAGLDSAWKAWLAAKFGARASAAQEGTQ